MATARSQRTRKGPRFFDSEDSFQKLDINTQTFASFPIYKHVRSLLSVKFFSIEDLLAAELEKSRLYKTCWEEAIKELEIIEEEVDVEHDLPEECQLAIVAYTLDLEVGNTKLFTDFNAECRNLMKNGTMSESAWKNFPYKSLYALLARSIHGISNNPDVKTAVYYRGMPDRLTNLKKGDYVFSKQFLSCSVDKNVAQSNLNIGRLSHPDKNKQHVGTLIKFEGSPLAACGVVDLSAIPQEEEILVFPWSIFKVKQVVLGDKMDQVVFESIGSFVKDLPYSGTYAKKGTKIRND